MRSATAWGELGGSTMLIIVIAAILLAAFALVFWAVCIDMKDAGL